jgi:hypothetical protein
VKNSLGNTSYFEVKVTARTMQEGVKTTLFTRLSKSPAFRSIMLFSAFRAVYGMGILVVTYFIATSDNLPIWTSVIFLLFSMVFSRILFKFIKKKWAKGEDTSEPMVPTTVI